MGQGPSHKVYLTDRNNKKRRTHVGTAWMTRQGWMEIKLFPGVRITTEGSEEHYYINLYPTEAYEKQIAEDMAPPTAEEDIPF